MTRLIYLMSAALLVSACGHTVTTGYVASTRLDPAHTETRWRQQYAGESCTRISTGKSSTRQVCSARYISIPYDVDVPDRCYETLQDEEGTTEYPVACGHEHKIGDRVTAR